jgi:hypothetical protein
MDLVCTCRNLSLGLATKARACDQGKGLRRCDPRVKPRSHISCSRECRRVWRNEPSHSQRSFHLGSWSSSGFPSFHRVIARVKTQCIDKFLISLEIFYNVDVYLGSHDPLEHLKHKLWPKEGPGVKLLIWLLTTKSQESPQFPCVRWCAKYRWKDLHKGYNFTSRLISIRGLTAKLWAPKVAGVLIVGISGLALGNPGTKWHLGVGPMASVRNYCTPSPLRYALTIKTRWKWNYYVV